ncbi:MAG: hypothetical protein OYL92_15190 [Acidobacteriota bacterium]|nr:hypothetical protein [Acidobacteriota bacterium]MDE3266311.1 hypothetical protein [Acidobacteriota bacterium]
MKRLSTLGPVALALFASAGAVQGQTRTWHDDSFTASDGRTLLYRYWVMSDWDLTTPRGAVVYFHGNNDGTAEQLRQTNLTIVDPALELGLAFVVLASPWSTPAELSFGERTLLPETVGAGGTRFWASEDARLVHELLQSSLKSKLALDHDGIVFAGGSQGTCFLAHFIELYGGSYGGGFHAFCGCFWLDFDGDSSHDTYAIQPPFHRAPWRPSFQWTPAATTAVRDRFKVFVEATTEDFLHPAAVSMSRYYSEWLGLDVRTDLDSPGGHCRHSGTPRREIYDWLSSGSQPPRPGSGNDTDGDGTPNESDLDDDGDGAPDFIDDLPRDRRDWRDSDRDGIADALDPDADGDGVNNDVDAFPLDPRERRDTDGDGIGDGLDDDDGGPGLAFVSRNAPLSGYTGTFLQARAKVHSRPPSGVVYPAVRGDSASYQFLELGDAGARFEILVDSFTRPESCPSVLLPQLCDVEPFAASRYYSSYFQDRFIRIWIDRNRNRDLTDDGRPLLTAWNTERPWAVTTTEAVLEVLYASGRVLPYAITMSARRGDLSNGLSYSPSSVWRGKVEMPSGGRLLALAVDGNADGRFDSPSDVLQDQDKDFVCLDLDRDGWLNECDFSEDARGNRTRPGALLPDKPFIWRGNRYELAIAPSGRDIQVVREGDRPDPSPEPDPPTTGCTPTATVLSFDGGYDVSMCYRTPQGEEGQAKSGIWASGQAGLLWFFDRGNAEVLVKVLDGCVHNGHRWVFVAPVTDLEFTLWVTGPNGKRWTHSNTQGRTAATRSDTSAFRCADEDAGG